MNFRLFIQTVAIASAAVVTVTISQALTNTMTIAVTSVYTTAIAASSYPSLHLIIRYLSIRCNSR